MTTIYAALAGLVTLVGLIFAAYRKGYSTARVGAENADIKGNLETRKAIDDADASISDDPAVLRDWLRARDKKQH